MLLGNPYASFWILLINPRQGRISHRRRLRNSDRTCRVEQNTRFSAAGAVFHSSTRQCGRAKKGTWMTKWTTALLFLAATFLGGSGGVEGQLRWPGPPKEARTRIRLVAAALIFPRSSYFSSEEVFVAETEIGDEEWSLIKLVFTFLPYQPRLSESGFDYSIVHEVSAWRDPQCDETVTQLTARSSPPRHEPLIYSANAPRNDLDRRHIPLPCYQTNADAYIKSSLEPVSPPPEPPKPAVRLRPRSR